MPSPSINPLQQDLEFLEKEVIPDLLKRNLKDPNSSEFPKKLEKWPSDESDQKTTYTAFSNELSFDERTTLLIGLAPHIYPELLERAFRTVITDGEFAELGGIGGTQFRGFLPTAQTAIYLLAGRNADRRAEVLKLFSDRHHFRRQRVLFADRPQPGEPFTSGRLIVEQDNVELLTTGNVQRPGFSVDFPAYQLKTGYEWDDLVLPTRTLRQIDDIKAWLIYGESLLEDEQMGKKLKPGYRVLFYGAPGTGKTLTAALLGKPFQDLDGNGHANVGGAPVYRIDLSTVVSKFIGETEKNLASLFDRAEHKDWILLFDEADALFGKRTTVKDAHDKYANQEVSYLLQRLEHFPGLVILATNFKANIDSAFARRFQSIIHFPMPGIAERKKLWSHAFPKKPAIGDDVDLDKLASKYELTGAHIVNIAQYTSLRAMYSKKEKIELSGIEDGIKRELHKEGRSV